MNWLNHALLHLASLLVRDPDRPEWLAEWKSELWYVLHDSHDAGREALWFCLGAFRDAAWLRISGADSEARRLPLLQSPLRCLALLALAAATASFFFFRSPDVVNAFFHNPRDRRDWIPVPFLLMAIALLVLPTTTSLALGEYPRRRLRRWIFLLFKFALIFPIVLFGTLDLSPVIGIGLIPDLVVLGYVLAFRWAFIDQRQRCPVCLRLLTSPARIGEASHTLLDSYGTEFCCTRGHGLLHVPANSTSYSTQRWLELDSSWSGLFRSNA
jgi:hypothetical protein